MKKNIWSGASILILAFLFLSSAHSQFPDVELEIVRVNDDMYVIHNEFVPGNVTALITDEGVLLVDAKFETNYERMMELLGTVTDQPVRYVINTHYHSDHSGGNALFKMIGAEIIASEQARYRMVDDNLPGLPNFTLEEYARIHVGGKVVEMYYFGAAHTDGDVVVYFPEYRTLAAGDMFTYGDATPQLIDYRGGGNATAWTKTLDGVLQLGFETVIPGHGEITTKVEMQNFRESTVRLRTRVREMSRQGSSREEIAAMLRDEYHWQDLMMDMGLDGILAEMR